MFRTLSKSKLGIVLAILFGISLFFIRSGSRYSNLFNSDSVVASVSGTKISTTKFNRTIQMDINKFNQMLGKEMTGDEIRAFQIHSLSLGALINDAAFEDEYNKINLKIDEKVIAQQTKKRVPQLYDKKNNLNEMFLNTFLQQQKLKIEDLVQIIDFETRNNYFSDALFQTNYPYYFYNKIKNFDKQNRQVSYLEIPFNKVNIDEIKQKYFANFNNELEIFYKENINNYMSTEKRNVEYLTIDKSKYDSDFVVNEFEIKEYFENNKQLFFENEKRSFIQFNFKTIQEAKNFQEKTKNLNIKEIIKLSKNNNIIYSEFINLQSNEILEKIANSLFSLNIKEKSNIIETPLAKHILILQSIVPAYQKTLKNVKDEISSTIKQIETNNYYEDLLNQISKTILNGGTLYEIANNYNVEIKSIKKIDKNYKEYNKSNKIFFDTLIQSSFKSNKDFVSDVISLNNNYAFVFNVSEIFPSAPLKIKDIEEILIYDWENTKKMQKIQLDVEKNKDNRIYIDNLANQYDLTIKEDIFSKDSKELPSNIVNEIFISEKNINIQYVLDQKFYIYKINSIIMPKKENYSESFSLANDLRNIFGQELIKNKKIKINDNLISAIIEQY